MSNGNGAMTVTTPRKISVPLVRVVTGVAVGLSEVAAEFIDESRSKLANDVTSAQVLLPVVGTVVGIGMGMMKNKSARKVGNDIAVGYGAIATLKLGNVARGTISARKLKKLRSLTVSRGGGHVASRSIAPVHSNTITTMSMA